MAVPTFTSISVSSGPAMGGYMVEIIGTNFRLPDPPPATGPVPPLLPTVEVTFGGVASGSVSVASDSRIFVVVPKGSLLDANLNPIEQLVVDLGITNLDNAGVPIAGETVTVPSAFTYARVDLSHNNKSAVNRLVRILLESLVSETIANVHYETNTDYDEDTGTIWTNMTKVPGISVMGPDFTENTFYNEGGYATQVDLDGAANSEFVVRGRTQYDDVAFDIIGIADDTSEFLNLMHLLQEWVDRNVYFEFECVEGDASTTIQLPFTYLPGGQFKHEKQQGDALNSNLKVFRGQVFFEGFPRTGLTGVVNDKAQGVGVPVDDVQLQGSDQTGDNLPGTLARRSPPEPQGC